MKFLLINSIVFLLVSCYSFTGGSVPEHLKTLYIANVTDNSGFGNPTYKNTFMDAIIENFQRDGSFNLINSGGDARLNISISSIREAPVAVNPGELETDRKVTVSVDVEYYDFIKRKQIWKNTFSGYETYPVSNAQQGRDNAIQTALNNISNDILLKVVSGW